jgi:hypothetical protein
MTIYYVKQFNLYYAGTDISGTIRFSNVRVGTPAFQTREAAEAKCKELGEEHCEIEERILG